MTVKRDEVLIAGGGIGGLTLALELHRLGVPARVFESVAAPSPIGVGITILPHATRILYELGLQDALLRRCIVPTESLYYNRFGQFVYREPVGTSSGVRWPQLSIHRADLYEVLLEATVSRLGADRVRFGARLVSAQDAGSYVRGFFATGATAATGGESTLEEFTGSVLVGCDGIHSTLRRQLYPSEGEPLYQGINMWRGVTVWDRFLGGRAMLRVGWYPTGKLTIYPCRDSVDGDGRQLMNWIAAVETPRHLDRDWGRKGRLEDFIDIFADWKFDFLDVPGVLESAESILEFPMVDQEPLPRWSFGRLTLLGDAAHPMVPRGSNGAGQAIVDCRALADLLSSRDDPVEALRSYDELRRPATADVVYRNRANPPDAILREVCLRSGDRPFDSLHSLISSHELDALCEGYKDVAGYSAKVLTGGD